MDFEQLYQQACIQQTDIHEHLPVLSDLASQCSHVTELGVGTAQSTRAFLRHDIEIHSYEYAPLPGIEDFFKQCKESGRNVTLHIADTRSITIDPTDMLFVDSLHSYDQVFTELTLHAPQVRKFIGFHDTTLFEFRDEFDPNGRGIWPAIEDYMKSHPEWEFVERRTNNNGLTIYKRV